MCVGARPGDLAKSEVPAHKFADLSQRDYGVALLNDCKYGYKVKGNVLVRESRYDSSASSCHVQLYIVIDAPRVLCPRGLR